MSAVKQAGRRNALVGLSAGMAAVALSPQAFAATGSGDTAALEAATEALRSALVNGDGDVLKKILNEKMTYSHSDGRVWTKQVLIDNIAGKQRYLAITTSEQTVFISGQTGIVRQTFDVVNNDANKSRSHLKVLLCWTKTRGGWQMMARGSTTVPA